MNTENRNGEHVEKYACFRLIDALCRLLSRNNVEFDEYTTEIFDKFFSDMSILDHVLMYHASDENAMACKEEMNYKKERN